MGTESRVIGASAREKSVKWREMAEYPKKDFYHIWCIHLFINHTQVRIAVAQRGLEFKRP
jgi:hypothetical protein